MQTAASLRNAKPQHMTMHGLPLLAHCKTSTAALLPASTPSPKQHLRQQQQPNHCHASLPH
jgi:hypothetical protein